MKRHWRIPLLSAAVGTLLAACGAEAVAPPSSQPSNAMPPAPPSQVAPNSAPSISGAPKTGVIAGTTYVFQPVATDTDGNPLTFAATGLPTWATLNTQSGTVYGTPSEADVGVTGDIVLSVSDGRVSVSLPAFRVNVTSSLASAPPTTPPPAAPPPPATNNAPVISGTPPTSVLAGGIYSFTPTASDADGNILGFSIAGKPVWAVFSTATGTLAGTPTSAQVGSYPNIVISVSDGSATRALASFTITVTQPAPTGTAALSWSAPTQNTDGSPVTDLAGYRVYHGLTASALNDAFLVPGASNTSYTASQLGSGTHYFAVAAYSSSGVESALSAIGSKTIP